jgi:hypothetical protein
MAVWYKHPVRPRWLAWRYLWLARARRLTYPTLGLRRTPDCTRKPTALQGRLCFRGESAGRLPLILLGKCHGQQLQFGYNGGPAR